MGILAGILVVVVASFVIAYFAARTWHWAYVLVVVGIVLFSAGFFILAAETLRINAVLRSEYNTVQANLEKVTAQVEALEQGTKKPEIINQLRGLEVKIPDEADSVPSISDLDHDLRLFAQVRGTVWRNVATAGVNQQTGAVRVSIASPTPSGLVANTVVYLFEEGDIALPDPRRGAQYLGEFRVAEVAGQEATLLPALEMNEYQVQRLAASSGPWAMYETMPPDQHQLFADMTEEQLRQKLPEASVEEYIRHGKPSVEGDDLFRKAAYDDAEKRLGPDELAQATRTVYHRRLRDYALEFRKLIERRALLTTEVAGLNLDNQRMAEAVASAERLTTFRQGEAAKLNTDLAGLAKDRQAVDRLLTMIQQQVATIRTLLDQTLRENSQLVRELATRQAAAAAQTNQAQASVDTPVAAAIGRVD